LTIRGATMSRDQRSCGFFLRVDASSSDKFHDVDANDQPRIWFIDVHAAGKDYHIMILSGCNAPTLCASDVDT